MNNDIFWAAFQDEVEKVAIIGGLQGKPSSVVKPLTFTKAPQRAAGEVQTKGFPFSKKAPSRRNQLAGELRTRRSHMEGQEESGPHRDARESVALEKSFGPLKLGDPYSTQVARENAREGKMKQGSKTFTPMHKTAAGATYPISWAAFEDEAEKIAGIVAAGDPKVKAALEREKMIERAREESSSRKLPSVRSRTKKRALRSGSTSGMRQSLNKYFPAPKNSGTPIEKSADIRLVMKTGKPIVPATHAEALQSLEEAESAGSTLKRMLAKGKGMSGIAKGVPPGDTRNPLPPAKGVAAIKAKVQKPK